ncbi:DUF4129 domain-containing transglutaminase family protein [Falsibacillus albus]|uniref:DUF4129 domain-containing protein n=1 Tax=Falsibacillus albus TaxID=2478915 RepID=A0A3L7JK24_9BACI|nr:DUF4129 domain-containing transglutaminase family protein [Falsibacillus albus]RLQ91148.1 DUF4129 domain-containing protein [Falsibacillus albus]
MSDHLKMKSLYGTVLYFLGFLLLWEWLRPIEELTPTGNIERFLFFIILCLLLSFFQVNAWISAAVKAAYVLFTLHLLFFQGSVLSLAWLEYFFQDFFHNLSLLIHQDWYHLSDLFRSLLFFVLLWLMAYLLHYWLMVRKKIFIFYFLTIVYITVLDTFSPYEAKYAIIRIIIIGFVLLGILFFSRLMEKEALHHQRLQMKRWLVPLSIMVGGSAVIAYAAPKADPIWPDPVPFLKSYTEGAGEGSGAGISKIGYGTDDSNLGGPFIGDNTVVFTAKDTSKHYWKIETKDVYTGKGWELSDTPQEEMIVKSGELVPTANEALYPDRPDEKAQLLYQIPYTHVVQPYGIMKVQGNDGEEFHFNNVTEKLVAYKNAQPFKLQTYSVSYKDPQYSMKNMKAANASSFDPADQGDKDFLDRYTQLPDSLPPRVEELAKTITKGKDNWFDQAKAIEQYFKKPEFVYDQVNVTIPRDGQDYVDQFLFENNHGYCDNFSSSMVVLLRSIGIPARWVKGYTSGEYKYSDTGNISAYEVTNNDAHSWVEAFFPGVGWVPFEPTKGFDNNVDYKYDQDIDKSSTPPPVKKEDQQPKKPEKKPLQDQASNSSDGFSIKDLWGNIKEFFKMHWGWTMISILFVAAIGWGIFRTRSRWIPHVLVLRYRRKTGDEVFTNAYLSLLKQLDRSGLKMDDGQTLRSYARYIDSFYSTREMSRLTALYERVLYRQDPKAADWSESRKLWENLIKKTTG